MTRNELGELLNQLRETEQCDKNYFCIKNMFDDLIQAKIDALSFQQECISRESQPCKKRKEISGKFYCHCHLRRQVAIHIQQI